ncbi:MAG: SRPBCC family protein [bacterium]|nr:SRPBCC family protein [bacterium]
MMTMNTGTSGLHQAESNQRLDSKRLNTSAINVSESERRLSMLAGFGLVLAGMRMGGVRGVITLALGVDMVVRGVTGHCWIYRALGVNSAIRPESGGVAVPHQQGVRAESRILIDRPVDVVYEYWRNFENLPQFMRHLEKVEVYDETRSQWTLKAPAGLTVSWDTEVINDDLDQRIGWRSAEGASVPNAGAVNFKAADDTTRTEVVVKLEYAPPGGALGQLFAQLLGIDPNQTLDEDLRRLKFILEAEIETADIANPGGMNHGYTMAAGTDAPYGDAPFEDSPYSDDPYRDTPSTTTPL